MKQKLGRRILALALILIMASLWIPLASRAATGNTGNEAALLAAVSEDGEGDVILSASISSITKQLEIDRSLTLDLNGYVLSIDIADTAGRSSNSIKINDGVTLTIKDSMGGGSLNVTNRASSNASAGNGAAINVTDGYLVIQSGTVTATGGFNSAGIGGGYQRAGGTITVNGGMVFATGGSGGAGIGGGYSGSSGGVFYINGGTIFATGGSTGAGIGGGYGCAGGVISITGGTLTVQGGNNAAGIGGGYSGAGGVITVSGGTIATIGGDASGDFRYSYGGGAGIGCGNGGAGATITINGGSINAKGGNGINQYAGGAAGIGGGYASASTGLSISIRDGNVTATGGNGFGAYAGGAGIGGGGGNASGIIDISGGTITAIASNPGNSSAIGRGSGGVNGTIRFTGTYDYYVNTENTPPDEIEGTGEFPYKDTYKYIKLVQVGDGDDCTVTFIDWDGKVLKSQKVINGSGATAPPNPERPGWKFVGWDPGDFSNITSNLTVTAQYVISDDVINARSVDVQAKIVGDDFANYDVDIEWGDMKFVYDAGGRKWDSENHTYIDGTGVASWLIDNSSEIGSTATDWYLENGNNIIFVTNRSNVDIDVSFNYTMLTGVAFGNEIGSGATAFNADSADADAVVGGFYASEAEAKAGALLLKDPTSNTDYNTLPGGKISIVPASYGRNDLIRNIGHVYFAFSGTPDTGRSEVLPEFKRVGVITVTITPNYNNYLDEEE